MPSLRNGNAGARCFSLGPCHFHFTSSYSLPDKGRKKKCFLAKRQEIIVSPQQMIATSMAMTRICLPPHHQNLPPTPISVSVPRQDNSSFSTNTERKRLMSTLTCTRIHTPMRIHIHTRVEHPNPPWEPCRAPTITFPPAPGRPPT